jgi:hypothetical protein
MSVPGGALGVVDDKQLKRGFGPDQFEASHPFRAVSGTQATRLN